MKTGARGVFAYFAFLRFVAALVVVLEHVRDLTMIIYADAGRLVLGWKALTR